MHTKIVAYCAGMYTPEEIQHQFDAATLKYLQNKNRGGSSGQKGTRYEDYFAVYKLTQLARGIIEFGSRVHFSSQLLAFVDDLVIDINGERRQHYQLKNSSNVAWASGKHPIQADFANQQRLNQNYPHRSHLFLVVADKACATRLVANIPADIQPFSRVVYFPYAPDIMALLEQVPGFKDALTYLSAFENPEPDKLDYVAKALIGAWVTSNFINVSGKDLLLIAQRQTPQYIRSFTTNLELEPQFEKILRNIEDLEYNLAKGFLHWDYADGLQYGTQPYSIETDAFRRLQERIIHHNPRTFEELEPLL